MLGRLLESNAQRNPSVWGAALSTLLHTAGIGIAVYATAQARVHPPLSREVVRWVKPPADRATAAPARPTRPPERATPLVRALDLPERIQVATTPVEITVGLPPVSVAPAGGAAEVASLPLSADSGVAADPDEAFSAERVEQQAYLRPGSLPPRYPNSLRAAGIEGQATALFVVSEAGRVERETIRFTHSDNPLFEDAVRDALARMRFVAAEVGGRKVRQLVQMPFVFTLTR